MRWLFLLLFLPTVLNAQSGSSKRAWKNYSDGDYEKALELSVKSLQKDTLDALAWFVTSHLEFTPEFKPVEIDLADEYLRKTRNLFDSAALDQQDDYRSEGLNEDAMDLFRQQIDSAAFIRASAVMTEQAFIDFLENFAGARESARAIVLRDSLAFRSAVSENTYQAYSEFMEKYPDAREIGEARARYEKLYFDIATQDKHLESYLQFLEDNPSTPYRYEAEFNIFRIMTAENTFESYQRFINEFPESLHVSRARNYLYHLYRSADSLTYFPRNLMTDSLRRLQQKDGLWLPFIEDNQFGFMDDMGNTVAEPVFDEVFADYLCDGIVSDILIIPGRGVVNRNLDEVAPSAYAVSELSMGLLLLENGRDHAIWHKAGYLLMENSFDEAIITGNLIGISQNGRWGLASLTGQILLPPQFEEIIFEQGLYFLGTVEGWQVLTPEEIHYLANNMITGISSPVYDSYDFVGDERLWLRQGEVESVVDLNMEPVVSPARQRVFTLPSVYVARSDEEVRILSHDLMQRYTTGDQLLAHNDHWLILKKESGVGLYSLDDFRLATLSDSARLLGDNYAITWFEGNRRLHALNEDPILLTGNTSAKLLQANEREWILLNEGRNKKVVNRYGRFIYEGPVENVSPLTDSLLVLERYGRKELLNLRGEKPLQVRFDGIGSPEDGLIPLLSGQRFGAYDQESDLFVRPISTKKIQRYNDQYYIAEMDKFGLINRESRMVVDFKFDEIRHWNDTTCLVRQGSDWLFYNIGEGLIAGDPMKSIQMIVDSREEHEMIVFRNGSFGVINSQHGEVIPPTLDDILQIGSGSDLVYFSDKYVDEANLHVVVYFDRMGNILRKEALEEDQFDKIYCE